jgi:ERCC4-related helicase
MPHRPLVAGDLVRIRDERWIVARHTPGLNTAVLDVRGRDRTNLGARASFLLPFEFVERLPSSDAPRLVRARRWRRLARTMLAEATPSWDALRTPLRARISLLAYQLEPALAITRGIAARVLIADEVGLGKTIQTALIVCEVLERRRHGRVLVVAPASLREQWHAELSARFGVDAWLADASSLSHVDATWTDTQNPWCAHSVTITSLDYVKRPEVMRSLESLVWDVVVFDEAHALAGRSDRATAAGALGRRARTLVLLTATPHTGDDRAFDRLCRIGDLGGDFPLLVFRRTRHDVGLGVTRRTRSLAVRPSRAELEMHAALMTYARMVWTREGPSPVPARLAITVLVRRACSSAASLARSVERRLALLAGGTTTEMRQGSLPFLEPRDDEEPGAELAAPGLDNHEEERQRLEHILLLAKRAQTAESKLRTLIRFLGRTREPAIVFTEYRDTLTTVAEALHEFAPVTLHGGLSAADRRDSLTRFTQGNARLLVATDAASEGLNLQSRCRLVINLELPWTPLRLEQRIGRVERIGQTRRVHAVHLLAAGTPEESSVATLLRRTRRVAEALDGLRPPITEQHVAGVAIGQERVEQAARTFEPMGPAILVPRLRETAQAEVDRVEKSRSWAGDPLDVYWDRRPAVTILRRGTRDRSCVCAIRVVFAGADQFVWETLVGVTAQLGGCLDNPSDWITQWLAPALTNAGQNALVTLVSALRAPVDLACRREHAIADSLTAERARLSASLLQPGLFDRRAERALAAQSAVLDEALARCRRHLDEIAGTERLVVERLRLAFAVIRR